jgi:DNA (cytosine-5)-methyltransferase 1
MNHSEKLLEIYQLSQNLNYSNNIIENTIIEYLEVIADNCYKQKGVYTVLITLIVHKIIHPQQDIRCHQSTMRGGFSGRTIDTQYITPILKQLGLPAMAESGWLTRSLEQPYPYLLSYEGKISNKEVKQAFLHLLDFIENNHQKAEIILKILLNKIIIKTKSNQIKIIKIDKNEKFDIKTMINCLQTHFNYKYNTRGGSKLPVIAFYAIYQSLINELDRYKNFYLKELGSHTASDRTSKTACDISIIKQIDHQILEVLEIKYGKKIDLNMVINAKEKIFKFNPERYYIFSSLDIKKSDLDNVNQEIENIAKIHGCQIIINGIIPTLKYYLRLITSTNQFLENYSTLIEIDTEIKTIHKEKWNQILSEIINKE